MIRDWKGKGAYTNTFNSIKSFFGQDNTSETDTSNKSDKSKNEK
jgi:hypothetical protein